MRVYKSNTIDKIGSIAKIFTRSFYTLLTFSFTPFCNLTKKAEEQVGSYIERLREEESQITRHPYYVWKTQRYYVFFFHDNESNSLRKAYTFLSKGRLD